MHLPIFLGIKKGFPKFKSKKNPVQFFNVPQGYKIDFENNRVHLPKIGWIKIKLHRHFEGKQQTAVISMTSTGKYYISILIENRKPLPEKQTFNEDSILWIDLGLAIF